MKICKFAFYLLFLRAQKSRDMCKGHAISGISEIPILRRTSTMSSTLSNMSTSSGISSIVTPPLTPTSTPSNSSESSPMPSSSVPVYPKSYKKQASKFHANLPKRNVAMRCTTGLDSFLQMVRSPTTSQEFPKYLAGSEEFKLVAQQAVQGSEVALLCSLHKDIMKITLLHSKKMFCQAAMIWQKWRTEYGLSIRTVVRKMGYTYNHLWWLLMQQKSMGK